MISTAARRPTVCQNPGAGWRPGRRPSRPKCRRPPPHRRPPSRPGPPAPGGGSSRRTPAGSAVIASGTSSLDPEEPAGPAEVLEGQLDLRTDSPIDPTEPQHRRSTRKRPGPDQGGEVDQRRGRPAVEGEEPGLRRVAEEQPEREQGGQEARRRQASAGPDHDRGPRVDRIPIFFRVPSPHHAVIFHAREGGRRRPRWSGRVAAAEVSGARAMIIVWGSKLYGKVDVVGPGSSTSRRNSAISGTSRWSRSARSSVLASKDDNGFQGVKIPMSFRSILMAWLRTRRPPDRRRLGRP